MLKKIIKFIFEKYDDQPYCIYKIFGIKIITKPLRLQINSIHEKINILEKNIKDELWSVANNVKTEMWSVANNVKTEMWSVANNVKTEMWSVANNINENSWNISSSINKTILKCIERQKSKYSINIDNVISKSKNILITKINNKNMKYLFSGNASYFEGFYTNTDLLIAWNIGIFRENLGTIDMALYLDLPLLVAEDGFIKAATTWVNQSFNTKYIESISYVFSNLPHFFADEITTIEYMLNNKELTITKEQVERSKRVIKKIVENKITKYNHQPIYTPSIGSKNRKKVLVVDQSYGDLSIFYGRANDETFNRMLDTAIKNNHDCDIIIKTHPDALAQNSSRKKCYYSKEDERENVYLMSEEINPLSLLEIVDKVYVCSSQLGFEALMLGKEVHVFGMPFYAGYGLTYDYQKCERRTSKRTLEEMFYISYIMYTYYVNPDKKAQCEIEEAIDYLIRLRKEYFLEFNVRCDDISIVDLSERDFSLNSGERVVSIDLNLIRYDHRVRYDLITSFLKEKFKNIETLGADIFCGNGYGSYIIASSITNTNLLSVDGSEEAIELAKKHYNVGERIKYEHKLFPFEIEENKYDYICCIESIEHVKDDALFLESVIKGIKGNGYLFLSTPNESKLPHNKKSKFHYRHYTMDEMNVLFKKYNLVLVEQYGQDSYVLNANKEISRLNGTPIFLEEKEMQLKKNYEGQFNSYILKVIKNHNTENIICEFGNEAMIKLLKDYSFETVLDIGCGAGEHTEVFLKHNKIVTALDYGDSLYFRKNKDINVIIGDFNTLEFNNQFDCVWCSHVLEHQLNQEFFLKKCFDILKDGGILAITVPPLKHQIVGGHVSLWNAGLLLYNLIIVGFNCKDAIVKKYGYNISVILRKNPIIDKLDLSYDIGDIRYLKSYFPTGIIFESNDFDTPFNGDIENINWK